MLTHASAMPSHCCPKLPFQLGGESEVHGEMSRAFHGLTRWFSELVSSWFLQWKPSGLFADLCPCQICFHFWEFVLAIPSHQNTLSSDTCMCPHLLQTFLQVIFPMVPSTNKVFKNSPPNIISYLHSMFSFFVLERK